MDIEARIVKIEEKEIKCVSAEEITKKINELYPDVKIKSVSDKHYYTVSESKWKEIIKSDFVNYKKYLSDRFDCDDFSRCLVSRVIENYHLNAIGIAWGWMKEGAYHAWNFIYTAENVILFVEPQNDYIWIPIPRKFDYEACEIFM